MQRYLARRPIFGVLTAFLVSLFVFTLMRIAPGEVAQMIAVAQSGGDAVDITEEQLDAIRASLGLDDALHIQYFKWIGNFIIGDWGQSLFRGGGVFEEFKAKFPITLELVILSQIIAVFAGVPAGVIMALKRDTWIDYVVRIVSLAGLSLPSFWSATLLLVGGAYFLNWNPKLVYVPFFDDPLANLSQFIWPSLMLGYISAATKARMMRSTMLEVLRQDYIRTAHAKGLASYVVTTRHAVKNAFIPVITVIGITTALALGGSVVIERIFTLPGIGSYIVDGMLTRDFPVVQSIVLVFAVIVVAINLFVDLSYGWLDSRVRFNS